MIVCKCGNARITPEAIAGDGDGVFEVHAERNSLNEFWVQNNGQRSDGKVILFCNECNRHDYIQADHGEDKEGVLKRLTIEGYYLW